MVSLLTAPRNVNEEGGTGTTCVNKASNDLTVSFCLVGCVWSKKKGSQNTQHRPFNLQLTASVRSIMTSILTMLFLGVFSSRFLVLSLFFPADE